MARKPKPPTARTVEALRHRREEATRKNIPTAQYQSVLAKEAQDPVRGAYERRAATFIGPEFGTVPRPDLVAAAPKAADAGFDALIACAFNDEAHATEFSKLGRIPVLKARMNADLFVIFGEPDITLLPAEGGRVRVRVNGVDVFDPSEGEVRSDGPAGIACWFIDTEPTNSLHVANGLRLNGLIAIEYGFHITLMVAGAILAYFFLTLLRQQAMQSR